MNTNPKLTQADLDACLEDERHLGFGYSIKYDLSASKQQRLDRSVVAVANELGTDRETFFHWTNSKYGRWLVDQVYGCSESPSRATVRRFLNAEALVVACEGVEVLS